MRLRRRGERRNMRHNAEGGTVAHEAGFAMSVWDDPAHVPPLDRAQLQAYMAFSTYIAHLGLEVLRADAARQEVAMRCPMRPEFERGVGSGQWHGGPIAAVIDTVADFALTMMLGRALPTIDLRIDYLRPAVHTALLATARVRRQGRSVGVVDVDVENEAGVLVAIGRGAYATRLA